MNPNACLCDIFNALDDGDFVTAAERADDLREWLEIGGFYPGAEILQRSSVEAFVRYVGQLTARKPKED
jgi:hypothetical protein